MKRGILAIGMLASLSLPLLAGTQEGDLAEKLYRSGERAYASKTYAEAMDTWTQLVQQVPRSPQASWALLRMARHEVEVEHRPQAAMPLLDRLKQEYLDSPAAPEALLLRGQLLARQAKRPQDLREAMAEFNRVSDVFPNSPQALEAKVNLGQAFLDQDQPAKALPLFLDPAQADPATPIAALGLLGAATALDRLGDTKGSLTLLQRIQELHPQSPEASEARWRLLVIVRHRLQKPPWRSQGPWPRGRTGWLKTPTLLAAGLEGDLYIYQDDLDQVSRLRANQLTAAGPSGKNAKAFAAGPEGNPWLLIPKTGAIRDNGTILAIPGLSQPSGGFVDRWGTLWVGDAKASSLTLVAPDGTTRSLPSPAASALVPLPSGGAAVASDANRSLLFLDANGQSRVNLPYGKGLPNTFKSVVALASDPLGHVAALVEGGDFDGIVLWGPDGTVFRYATFRMLGISGRFRALALDREGGIILADRSNDLLLRIE